MPPGSVDQGRRRALPVPTRSGIAAAAAARAICPALVLTAPVPSSYRTILRRMLARLRIFEVSARHAGEHLGKVHVPCIFGRALETAKNLCVTQAAHPQLAFNLFSNHPAR